MATLIGIDEAGYGPLLGPHYTIFLKKSSLGLSDLRFFDGFNGISERS
ncbi:MAG: hypothetical protein ACYSO7_13580 [Planctomycetota bacterium]|jgi:hypothetical protein